MSEEDADRRLRGRLPAGYADLANRLQAKVNALEAENARLRLIARMPPVEGWSPEQFAEEIRYQKARAERAEAACAEKDKALRAFTAYPNIRTYIGSEIYDAARAALSDTCGQRYRDIVEAAKRLMPADFTEHPQDFTEEWHKLHRALAATEPTDEGGKP